MTSSAGFGGGMVDSVGIVSFVRIGEAEGFGVAWKGVLIFEV